MFCTDLCKCLLLSFHHSLKAQLCLTTSLLESSMCRVLEFKAGRNSDTVLWRIRRWLTGEVAENKSLLSQRGTEAGGSSTIQSSVEQKPSEACRSEQMQFCWWFCAKREAVYCRQNPRCANSETAVVHSSARCTVYTLQRDGLEVWRADSKLDWSEEVSFFWKPSSVLTFHLSLLVWAWMSFHERDRNYSYK